MARCPLLALLGWSLFAQAPDLILVNGRVFTATTNRPFVEALAITGARISAAGPSTSIRRLAGPSTQIIDLEGRFVTPGFNDAHTHFLPDWVDKTLPFSGRDPSCQEALQAVIDAVRTEPAGTVITGVIGASAFFDGQCTPAKLTGLAPDHPVMLRTWTPHAAVMNQAMSRRLGVDEDAPPVLGGFFGKDMRARHWDGVVHEFAAIGLYSQLLDKGTEPACLRDFLDRAARWGITSIQLMSAPEEPGRLVELLAAIDPPIRVRVIPYPFTTGDRRVKPVYPPVPARIAERVRVDGVKWLLDGTPIERSAALRQPYADDPAWSGAINFSDSELRAIVEEARDSDTPLMVHAVGDRTTDSFLNALVQTGGSTTWARRRVRIEHGDGLMPDLIARARKLGVVVVFNPTHLTLGPLAARRFGPERMSAYQPVRALLEEGIPLAIGSDGEMNPGVNLMLAAAYPARPEEALTRKEAITAYTSTAAYAEFEENQKGTLEPGKLADIAVFSQDILKAPAEELPKTHSVLTIVGGKVVYQEK
jgi:predicted amidohydrolase YtcJ